MLTKISIPAESRKGPCKKQKKIAGLSPFANMKKCSAGLEPWFSGHGTRTEILRLPLGQNVKFMKVFQSDEKNCHSKILELFSS